MRNRYAISLDFLRFLCDNACMLNKELKMSTKETNAQTRAIMAEALTIARQARLTEGKAIAQLQREYRRERRANKPLWRK